MSNASEHMGAYTTGADFWRDLAATHGLEEAVVICGGYLDTQIRPNNLEENRFCRELFTAMYDDTAGRADPAKIVYPYSLAHAEERRELSFYHGSRGLTEACARDIDSAIADSCNGVNHYNNLEAAARKVLASYGFERVNTVLAHNLQTREYDGRFSPDNRQWASGVALGDRMVSGSVLTAHPILIDGLVSRVREMGDALCAERAALPGKPERGTVVQGYEVLRSIRFDNDRGFALAHNPGAPQPFVTWQFTVENGKRDFYWGRYCSTEQAARDRFATRVALYMRNDPAKEVSPRSTAQEKPSVLGMLKQLGEQAKAAEKPPGPQKRTGQER